MVAGATPSARLRTVQRRARCCGADAGVGEHRWRQRTAAPTSVVLELSRSGGRSGRTLRREPDGDTKPGTRATSPALGGEGSGPASTAPLHQAPLTACPAGRYTSTETGTEARRQGPTDTRKGVGSMLVEGGLVGRVAKICGRWKAADYRSG